MLQVLTPGSSRITRLRKQKLKQLFPHVDNFFDINVQKATALGKAIAIINKCYNRRRTSNKTCPITFKEKKDIEKPFYVVCENGSKIVYESSAYAQWVAGKIIPTDPWTRRELTSIELRRLTKLVPEQKASIFDRFQTNWSEIFLEATEDSLRILFPYMNELMQEYSENLHTIMANTTSDMTDVINAFTCQFSYLYVISKRRYRRMKEEFMAYNDNSTEARESINIIDGVCTNVFNNLIINYIFDGTSCIPQLSSMELPQVLL